MFYLDPLYIVLFLTTIALGGFTQLYIKSMFARYSQIRPESGLTGQQVAQRILQTNGIYASEGVGGGRDSVAVMGVGGNLSDHYDPRTGVVSLSKAVHQVSSVAANAVAAHEVGHALQSAQHYVFGEIRSALVPAVNFGSQAAGLLIIVGIFSRLLPFLWIGIAFYSLSVVFQIVTLPVELNASKRALVQLRDGGILTSAELPGARKVLRAAALTYVASALISVLYLLYYLGFARRR